MAIVTGKLYSCGQSFHRKLLSEYNAQYTLANYVAYFELKDIVKKLSTAKSEAERRRHEDTFFHVLQESFRRVKKFLLEQQRAVEGEVSRIKEHTEEEILALDNSVIPRVFHAVKCVATFRELNLQAFGKILRKFSDKCAIESLESQRRVRAADRIIATSELSEPTFDANMLLNNLCTMYGIVFRKSFEDVMKEMDAFARRDSATLRRIVPLSDTYFFYHHFAHREPQGHFAMKIIAGRASKGIGKFVCEHLHSHSFPAAIDSFANGEVSVVLEEAVRGDDVYIIQSMASTKTATLSTIIMELALTLQTSMQNSAARVTAVIPYIAYTKSTGSIAALSEILVAMGCKHVITVDLYKEQVEGMFPNCPVDNVSAKLEFIKYLTQQLGDEGHDFTNLCVVSPDSETVGRAHSFADSFMKYAQLTREDQFVPIITAVKRVSQSTETPISLERPTAVDKDFPDAPKGMASPKRGISGTIDVVGNVAGRLCIIIDCVIDEAVNVTKVAQRLKQKGAARIIAIATHAIFSGNAVEWIVNSSIDELLISDSINQDDALKNADMAKKLRIVSIAPLLAQAMQRVHTENTLSTLFEK